MVSEFLSGMTRIHLPSLTQWAYQSSTNQVIEEVNYRFSRRISYVASTGVYKRTISHHQKMLCAPREKMLGDLIRTRYQEMDLKTTSSTGSPMIGTLVDGHGAYCRSLPLNRHSFLMEGEIKRQHPGSQQTVSLSPCAAHSRWLAPAHRAPYRHATRGRCH